MNSLEGLRILVCGKGGSGKSSIITLFARVLEHNGYKVIIIDGDASNPDGLRRLTFGANHGPMPLIDYFGGRDLVECPTDDPRPLTRINNAVPVTENHINFSELPGKYYLRKDNLYLFQVGKINRANEGCDGPMSKVTRDFIVDGNYVTLIDTEAGIEHFGRGVEKNIDIVLIIVSPDYESITISGRISRLCSSFNIKGSWVIINNVRSKRIQTHIRKELKSRNVNILGSVRHDQGIHNSGLMGTELNDCEAQQDVENIIKRLEALYTASAS